MTAQATRAGTTPSAGRGIQHAGLSFLLTLVISLVSAVVVSRLFGVEVIGEFALASAAAAMLPQFSSAGEQIAMVRSLAHEGPASRRAVSVFLVVLAFSTALTVLAAGVVSVIAVALLRGPVDQPAVVGPSLVLVLGYVLFGNISWNCDRLLSAFRGTRMLLFGRLFDVGFLLLASVTAGLLGAATVWGLAWATVTTLGLALALRVVFLARLVTARPTRASLRDAAAELPALISFGIRTVPGSAASGLSSQAGVWLIGAVSTVASLGAYSRANNLASRIVDAGFRLSEALLPVLAHAVHEQRYREAADGFARWRLLIAVGLVGACSGLAGAAEGLLAIFGPGFSAAWIVMGMLLFAYSSGVLTILHADVLVALGHPTAASNLALARCAVMLSLLGPLTYWFDIEGTGAAVLTAYLLELVAVVVLTARRLGRHGARPAPVPWARLLLAATVAIVVGRLLDSLSGSILLALVAATVSLLVFAGSALLLRVVDPALARATLASVTGRGRGAEPSQPPQPPAEAPADTASARPAEPIRETAQTVVAEPGVAAPAPPGTRSGSAAPDSGAEPRPQSAGQPVDRHDEREQRRDRRR